MKAKVILLNSANCELSSVTIENPEEIESELIKEAIDGFMLTVGDTIKIEEIE